MASANSAQPSLDVRQLFPPGVAAAELRTPGEPAQLSADEAVMVSHCAPKRVQDFAAGRQCARRALHELGVQDFALLAAPDRRPLWPQSIVGSITHTHGYSAAVVGQRAQFEGLGLDTEVVAAVNPEVWSHICTSQELERVRALPLTQQGAAAALIFAAKEAFYKCQYPLTLEWLGFEDVLIDTADWSASSGQFEVRALLPLRVQEPVPRVLRGRFRHHEQFVSAGIALNLAG